MVVNPQALFPVPVSNLSDCNHIVPRCIKDGRVEHQKAQHKLHAILDSPKKPRPRWPPRRPCLGTVRDETAQVEQLCWPWRPSAAPRPSRRFGQAISGVVNPGATSEATLQLQLTLQPWAWAFWSSLHCMVVDGPQIPAHHCSSHTLR